MLRSALLPMLLLFAGGTPARAEAPTAAEAVRLALADARRTNGGSATAAGRTRYISAHNQAAFAPAGLGDTERVLKGLIPSLSRGTGRTGLRPVASVPVGRDLVPWLWAFDAGDYDLDLVAWANLGIADPYFHAPSHDRAKPFGIPEHLPQREYQELNALTQTERGAPIFRADWVVYRTSQQSDRLGDGYYDFLGLRSVDDVNKLAGLDEAAAVKLDADRRAFVTRSGPGLQSRQIVRFDAPNGPAWKTLDAASSTGDRNVAVRLDLATADGGMGVYTLPNRLVFSHLFKVEKGREVLIDVAPANVAANRTSPTNDLQIHAGACQHCHLSGMLFPFDGRAARSFHPTFASADAARAKRVRAVWLAEDLAEYVEGDQARHDRYMGEAAGVGYRGWGKLHRAAVAEYLADVTPAKLAAEMGTTVPQLRRTLARFERREGAGRNNPVAALFASGDAAVRRELVEEVFPLLMAEHRQESK